MLLLPAPRRYQRSLLLPPGLVALAWLLLLGCVALPQIQSRYQFRVLEVAIWSKKICSQEDNNSIFVEQMRSAPPCLPLTALEEFRPWYTFSFVGQPLPDYFALQNIRIVTRQFHYEPNLDRGMRVQFALGSNYTNLIQLYDWLNEVKASKYWLDMAHEPTTLYTYTEKPRIETENQNDDLGIITCGCCTSYTSPTTFIGSLEALFRSLAEALLSPDWRSTWLLLLLLSLVSGWRMVRQWRRAAVQNGSI